MADVTISTLPEILAANLGANGYIPVSQNGVTYRIPFSALCVAVESNPYAGYDAEVLIIGGGGGGGSGYDTYAGGGGAGGILKQVIRLIKNISYSITVGDGGGGDPNTGAGSAVNGQNSVFGSFIAYGGGGGAAYQGWNFPSSQVRVNAGNGGSGGGGSDGRNAGTSQGGIGTPGQGNNGGSISGGIANVGCGGGGAGSIGNSNSNTTGGAGGIGISIYSEWGAATSTGQNVNGVRWFGGGGGGCSQTSPNPAGGLGGGGASSRSAVGTPPIAGLANTGGGGGGYLNSNGNGYAAKGGSGLVIVRYQSDVQKGTGGTVTQLGGYFYHAFKTVGSFSYIG